jgi:uncharacterized protein YndB with AHSA1/START domain
MGVISVEARAHSSGAVRDVFEVLADSARYPEWAMQDEARIERPGSPDPDGVGTVRILRTGRYTLREEIVAFQRPRLVAYRVLSGIPVRDYRGETTLTPAPDGTDIHWRATFRSAVPGLGPVLRPRMRRVLATMATDLARRTSAAGGTGSPGGV